MLSCQCSTHGRGKPGRNGCERACDSYGVSYGIIASSRHCRVQKNRCRVEIKSNLANILWERRESLVTCKTTKRVAVCFDIEFFHKQQKYIVHLRHMLRNYGLSMKVKGQVSETKMLNSVLFPVPGNTSTTSHLTVRPRYGTTAKWRRRSSHQSSKQKTNKEYLKSTKRN